MEERNHSEAICSQTDNHDHVHVHEHGKDHLPTDKVGMALSFLCLIHCLIGPFLLIAIPGLKVSLDHEVFHWIMLGLVIPVACFSFIRSYKSHNIKFPLKLGSVGILFLLVGVIVPEIYGHDHVLHDGDSDHFGEHLNVETLETVFTVIGGLILAYAHYFNFRQCQCKD